MLSLPLGRRVPACFLALVAAWTASVMFAIVRPGAAKRGRGRPCCALPEAMQCGYVRSCEDGYRADDAGQFREAALGRTEPFGRGARARATGAPANLPPAARRSGQDQ